MEELLKARWGVARLNIRTGAVKLGEVELTADQISRFYLEVSNYKEEWSKGATEDAIWKMAEENAYDPVKDYLKGLEDYQPLPMEQWKRLDRWLLGIDDPIAADFLPQFFVSAVARVLDPGCEARTTPVIIGPQQRGKTTCGRILFGEDYWVEGLSDLSRDSRMRCQTAWACELSELDGVTRRSDIEALKTFLTERSDSFRKPYGRGVIKTDRRFVFWATANRPPLRDVSGNSRFVCIQVPDKMLPLDWAMANKNALWSRALEQYNSGFNWALVTEEQREARNERNSGFQQVDPWHEKVAEALIKCSVGDYCSRDSVFEELDVPMSQRNAVNNARITAIAESVGWDYERRRRHGVPIRGFWLRSDPYDGTAGEEII